MNSDIYQHRRHNKNLLMVHVILVTKYRKPLLIGKMREDIKQHIYDTASIRSLAPGVDGIFLTPRTRPIALRETDNQGLTAVSRTR